MREFDAHIYFTNDRMESAQALQQLMREEFSSALVQVSQLVRRPIGPHPLPMFEANFKKEELTQVIQWLEKNRNGHVVLIHPVTGDDLADHTDSATWLGEPLSLDLSRL